MKDLDLFVLEFLNSQRIHIENCKQDNRQEKRIKRSFNDILKAVIKKNDCISPPKLIICNSVNKYSYIIPLKNKQEFNYYLLYDKHLNKINQHLNALFLFNGDIGHDLWKLSYELFVEESLIINDDLLVAYFGLNNVALGPYDIDTIRNNRKNQFMCYIQELYILAHEFGHWLFALSQHKNKKERINLTVNLNDFSDEVLTTLKNIYKNFSFSVYDNDYIAFVHDQTNIINSNTGIVEECVADAIAIAYVFTVLSKKYPNNQSKKLQCAQSLLLAMMNLQILAINHMTLSQIGFENETAIRFHHFRDYLELYFENDIESFNNMIEKTVIHYEDAIANPIMECFSVLEKRKEHIKNTLTNDGVTKFENIFGFRDVTYE